jgi:hypothetical protein
VRRGSSRAHSNVMRSDPRPWVASSAASSAYCVAKPLPSPDGGRHPADSHPPQSDAGAAPSLCSDEQAAPWITG